MKQWALGLMSNDEKRNILDQHKSVYNGYKTMQPQVSNTQPLYVQDFATDKEGITVNNKFNVKKYMNVGINEQVEKEESMCSECGGVMMEGECSECGWKGDMGEETQQVKDLKNVDDLNLSNKFDYTEDEEDPMDFEKGERTQDPHQVGPSTDDGFDNYDDGTDEFTEQVGGGTAPYQNFNSIKPAYNFISGGPMEEDDDTYEPMKSAWGDEDEMDLDNIDVNIDDIDDEGEMDLNIVDMSDDDSNEWEEIDVFSDVDDDLKESVKKQKNRIVEMMVRMKGFN